MRHGKVLVAVAVAVTVGIAVAARGRRPAVRDDAAPARRAALGVRPASAPVSYGRALLAVTVVVALGVAMTASGWRSVVRDESGVASGAVLEAATAPEPSPAPATSPAAAFMPDATPTPVPLPSAGSHYRDFVPRPLSTLSPEAVAYVASLHVPVGIAVVVPERGAVYVENGDQPFPLASVVKVPILLTAMDKAIREDRALTGYELRLIEKMITLSDNDAAIALWEEVGGVEGVRDYLRSAGLDGFELYDQWGASSATAREVALLLDRLTAGELLNEPSRAIAMDLMTRVDTSQRWGVTEGVSSPFGRATIGVKNGWYPDDDGWWVNSAGFVSSTGGPSYTIAILSAEQPSLEYGVWVIERIAYLINAKLQG